MIKAVIFDLDGLLVDTEIVSFKIYEEILSSFNISFTQQEYARNYSGKTEITNITNLIQSYHLPWTIDEGLIKCLEIEERLLNQGVALKTGARELLEHLKDNHFKITVASSSTKDRAFNLLNQHNIRNMFDDFVFAEDVSHSKPHPEVFLKAANKLRIAPEECIVLEDSENGILAAHHAGIPVICIPDMKIPSKMHLNLCLKVFPTLNEVRTFLKVQH